MRLFLTEDLAADIRVVVIGELDSFDDLIDSAQSSFEIDREPILGDAAGADVLELLQEGEAIPFPTPSGDVTEDEDDGPIENEDKKLPDDEDEDPDPTATPEEDTERDQDVSEPEELGLVGARRYESPQFGTTVRWSSEWAVDEALLVSDSEVAVDRMAVTGETLEATLYVSLFDASDLDPTDWLQAFGDEIDAGDGPVAIIEQTTEGETEIVLYSYELDDELLYGVIEVRLDETESVTIVVDLLGSEDDLDEAFDVVQDDIEIDGGAPFNALSDFPLTP